MALLQDQENRIRREEELRKRRGSTTQQLSSGLLFGILIAVGGLIIIAVILAIPKVVLKNTPNQYQQELEKRLAARLNEALSTATPKTIDAIRAKTDAGDFTLLATPNIKTTKKNTTITYDLHLVRGASFDEPIEVATADLPSTVQTEIEPKIVDPKSETSTIKVTVPSDVPIGSYNFTIVAKATSKEKSATAEFAVTTLSAANITAKDVQLMGSGTKWQATIAWETDTAANTWVEYTTHDQFIANQQTYAFTSTNENASKNHAIQLYYLEPDAVYHYRIKSVDDQNNMLVSEDKAFLTATPEQTEANQNVNATTNTP